MAFNQAQLDAIDEAIATGELEVEYEGRRVKYRSINELLTARSHIADQLARAANTFSTNSVLAEFSRD